MSEATATYERITDVTKDDDQILPAANAISCAEGGTIVIDVAGKGPKTKTVLAGVDYRYAVTRVYEASTATGIQLSYWV